MPIIRASLLALIAMGACYGSADIGPPPASAVATLTPQFFTRADNISPEMLQAQPIEPTKLFGTGAYKGKMAFKADTYNRVRIPANSTKRIVIEAANGDAVFQPGLVPGQNWFPSATGYLIGDRDASGNALSDADIAAGKGVVSAVCSTVAKYSRTTYAGTFFSIGFAFDIDNMAPTAADRYVYFCAVGIPQNGYARRAELICLVLEGTSTATSSAVIDGTSVPLRENDLFVDAAAFNAAAGVLDSGYSATGNFTTDSDTRTGKQEAPFTTLGYAISRASDRAGGTLGPIGTKPMGSSPKAACTIYVDTSVAPLDLLFSGSDFKSWGYDHIHVKPWPGRCNRLRIKRSGFGHLDAVPGKAPGQARQAFIPYNRVVFFDADFDWTNIQSLIPAGFITGVASVGDSFVFENSVFDLSGYAGDHNWNNQGFDGPFDMSNLKPDGLRSLIPQKEQHAGVFVNCSGRIMGTGGMTLIAGGHFVTSWDSFFSMYCFKSWLYSDYIAQQTTLTPDTNHSAFPLPIAGKTLDTAGQRSVIWIDDEVWPGKAKVSVSSNVVTVLCYAADGVTPMIMPWQVQDNPFYNQPTNPNCGVPPTIVFGSDAGQLAGVVLTLTGYDATRGWGFKAIPPSGVTLTDAAVSSAPNGFKFNSFQSISITGTDGQGSFASISSGAAKTILNSTDGISRSAGIGIPEQNTPDFIVSTVQPLGALSYLVCTNGRALNAGFSASRTPSGQSSFSPASIMYGTWYQPKATLTAPGVFTFKGTVVSYGAAQGLKVQSGAKGKIGTFAGPLAFDAAMKFTDKTGKIQTGLVWGMAVRCNGRNIGRIAQAGVNNTSAQIGDLPPYSFYIEDYDGGPDIASATAWEASYDQHGLWVGDDLVVEDDPARYEIASIAGPVVTVKPNSGGTYPAPTPSIIANYTLNLSVTNKKIVVIDRCWDLYGNRIKSRTEDVAKGDTARVSNVVQHNDDWQVSNTMPSCWRMEGGIWQCSRVSGINMQQIQHQPQFATFSTGTLNTAVGGDPLAIRVDMPTMPVTALVSVTTPVVVWLDGKWFNSYTFETSYSAVTNAVGFEWFEPYRHIRLLFLSGAYQGQHFRLYRQFYNGATGRYSITILDDDLGHAKISTVKGSGAMSIAAGDTYQQPLPLDNGSIIGVFASDGSRTQGRIFTPDLNNPGKGRVAGPFYGAASGGSFAPGAWNIQATMNDVFRVSSIMTSIVGGQKSYDGASLGGIERGFGWNNVGWVQSAANSATATSSDPKNFAANAMVMKGGSACRIAVIDTIHGGFGPGSAGQYGILKSEANFSNSTFGRIGATGLLNDNTVPDPSEQIDMTAANCSYDGSPGNLSTIDALTGSPVVFVTRTMTPRFGWRNDGSDIPAGQKVVIGPMTRLAA